jgi:3-hydroxyacyl-CoA dehydrogenase
VAAAKLAGTALIDQIVDGDLVQGAIVFAQGVLDKGLPLRRARDLKVQDPQGQAFLQFARNTVGAMSSSRLTVCT